MAPEPSPLRTDYLFSVYLGERRSEIRLLPHTLTSAARWDGDKDTRFPERQSEHSPPPKPGGVGGFQDPAWNARRIPWLREAPLSLQETSWLKYTGTVNAGSPGDLFISLKHGQGGARLLSGV